MKNNNSVPQFKIQVIRDKKSTYISKKIMNSTELSKVCREINNTLLFQEQLIILALNTTHMVIGYYVLSTGGINYSLFDLRILFMFLLNTPSCSTFVISHNHPSGNKKPSQDDIALTKKAKEAGKMLDLDLLDHVIVTENDYYSFTDEGIL